MIIHCDQCNTKFRLDDSKVPDKGVKVRCAKCKNIFFVQKEAPAEEQDFDVLLSGLGATAGEESTPQPPSEEKSEELPAAPPETKEEVESEPPEESPDQLSGRDDSEGDFFSAREESQPPLPQEEPEGDEFQFSAEEGEAEQVTVAAESGEAAGGDFDFGEYPFKGEGGESEAAEPAAEAAAAPQADEFDFGSVEFSQEEAPLAEAAAEAPAAAQTDEFDFGTVEFSQEEATSAEPEEDAATASQGDEFDFGTVEFSQEEPPSHETEDAGKAGSGFLGDEFDFGEEEPAEEVAEAPVEPETSESLDVGEFTFTPDTGSIPVEEEGAPVSWDTGIDEGEGEKQPPQQMETQTAVAEQVSVEVPESSTGPSEEVFKPAPPERWEAVPPSGQAIPSADEELPPLAISSRSKSSVLPVALTAVAVLLVLVIGGFGFYVAKEGSAAFDKLGLSFLAKWIGMDSSAAGKITVKNPRGEFMTNKEAGEIFVVTGTALNNFKQARASIQVKGTVLGPKGEPLMDKVAFCGNILSREQLETLPMSKIEEAMANPFGETLANLNVAPGKEVPFMMVFSGVPSNAGEFSVEVIGSAPANE